MVAWSGLWNSYFAENHSLIGKRDTVETELTRALYKGRNAARPIHALIRALNGVAAGATATASFSTVTNTGVAGEPVSNGGLRPITARTMLNRATTAADVTRINTIIDNVDKPASYPVDKSGNGGGGMLTKTYK